MGETRVDLQHLLEDLRDAYTGLAEMECGIAVSTLGKVNKRGWDWLGIAAPASNHVRGLIEVPDLTECLT